MKQRTFVPCLAVMASLTLVWVMWPPGKPRSVGRAEQQSAPTEVTEDTRSLRTRAYASQSASSLRRPLIAGPSRQTATAPPPNDARVDAAQVLAVVNQTLLQLRHLMPVRPNETEKALTPEQYASRLQRAIEMELTFQAARVQGVELTVAQQQRLEQIVGQHEADLERYKQYGVTWSSISPEQVEFEKRLLAAQMLEQNLVAQRAAVSPSPDPEMQSRYEHARGELLDQLQASANITKPVPAVR